MVSAATLYNLPATMATMTTSRPGQDQLTETTMITAMKAIMAVKEITAKTMDFMTRNTGTKEKHSNIQCLYGEVSHRVAR
mmetsp:Transcript_16462/g.45408  ORF Transcript_16462/g.45408 Transcript_16462/m.45408 type:complete len:80 (+) Transcript_16462:304-543(+)